MNNSGTIKFTKTNNFYFSSKPPNNTYGIDRDIFSIQSIFSENGKILVKSKKIINFDDFFTLPIRSSFFEIKTSINLLYSDEIFIHCVTEIAENFVVFNDIDKNQCFYSFSSLLKWIKTHTIKIPYIPEIFL